MVVTSQKKELRRELKAARAAMSIEKKRFCDERIQGTFLKTNTFRLTDSLLIYRSIDDEVATDAVIARSLEKNKSVFLPRCTKDDDGNDIMVFHRIYSLDDLTIGAYGIPEPSSDLPIFEEKGHCVCIVPGLAFDRHGYRIGYGKGYYDRFLKNFNGTKIGLCRHEFLKEHLPVGRFDYKVDMIITEKGITVPDA